ncbi:MAG: hypothetical protein ACOZAO_04785 [Patescibacteria group bacterium]
MDVEVCFYPKNRLVVKGQFATSHELSVDVFTETPVEFKSSRSYKRKFKEALKAKIEQSVNFVFAVLEKAVNARPHDEDEDADSVFDDDYDYGMDELDDDFDVFDD